MKHFEDLKIGDAVYVGFEKKTVTKIVQDDDCPDGIVIYISEDEFYYVYGYLSVDYCYGSADWIFTGKDAMIEHFEDELRDLEIEFNNKKSRYEQWLERAKELE